MFFLLPLFSSCEDVIDLDLKTAEPKLVIDASLNWFKGSQGNSQIIKLTLTAPFFDSNIPPATGATVTVTDSNNNIFDFVEQGVTGLYYTNNFIPVINETYDLTINYNNEIYKATETLIPTVPIEFVEQKNDGGFSSDEIEIKAYYTDPEGERNYYLFEFINNSTKAISLEVYDDEFTDGNQIFAFFSSKNLNPSDELFIRNAGISKRAYEYLNILLQQNDDESGDPFETQPSSVRGNCINESNKENFPFGYFRVAEVSTFQYTVE